MKKFFVLFEIPAATIDDWKKTTSPEQMKAQSEQMMEAWSKWMTEHGRAIVEMGAPLGRTKKVTAKGIDDVRNDLNYYSVVEADSHEAAAALFADHPHLQIHGSSIEIMDIPGAPPPV